MGGLGGGGDVKLKMGGGGSVGRGGGGLGAVGGLGGGGGIGVGRIASHSSTTRCVMGCGGVRGRVMVCSGGATRADASIPRSLSRRSYSTSDMNPMSRSSFAFAASRRLSSLSMASPRQEWSKWEGMSEVSATFYTGVEEETRSRVPPTGPAHASSMFAPHGASEKTTIREPRAASII